MTDTERLIEEAERLSECASPGPWRRGSVHAAEEVWAAYPESIAGLAGERLLLRLNPNFTREHDTAFIARARTLVPELAAALRETAARADKQKQQFDEALGDLMDGHAEEIRKRGLSNAVTAETYDACHAALRQTEEERDRERQRADALAAANVAANKRIVALEHERDAARAALARLTTPRPIAEAPRDGSRGSAMAPALSTYCDVGPAAGLVHGHWRDRQYDVRLVHLGAYQTASAHCWARARCAGSTTAITPRTTDPHEQKGLAL